LEDQISKDEADMFPAVAILAAVGAYAADTTI
jgi:hypothetical protein